MTFEHASTPGSEKGAAGQHPHGAAGQHPHGAQPGNGKHPDNRYTHGHEKAVLASHAQRTAQMCAAHLLAHLRPGMRLLDVGFGPGTITLDLAQAVAPGEVIGIENTEQPIATARRNARERADTRTSFLHADVMDLPFENDSFDVVHAHQVLQHLADPAGALRQMARVCRPGGLVAVRDADYAAMSWYPELPALRRWRSLYREIAHANQAEPDAGRHLRSWAHAAGLTELTITSSNFCYATTPECAAWGESQAQRVDGEAFRSQASRLGVEEAAVTAIVDAWRAWGSSPDAFFLIPNTELLARVA